MAIRRLQCENSDTDPIVWTNQRFIRWARDIHLEEYADNLKGTYLVILFILFHQVDYADLYFHRIRGRAVVKLYKYTKF